MRRWNLSVAVGLTVLLGLLVWRLVSDSEPEARRAHATRAVGSVEKTVVPRAPPAAPEAEPKPAAARPPLVFPPDRDHRGPVTLEIKVVDADGSPAGGAAVRVLRATREGWTDRHPVALLRADAAQVPDLVDRSHAAGLRHVRRSCACPGPRRSEAGSRDRPRRDANACRRASARRGPVMLGGNGRVRYVRG